MPGLCIHASFVGAVADAGHHKRCCGSGRSGDGGSGKYGLWQRCMPGRGGVINGSGAEVLQRVPAVAAAEAIGQTGETPSLLPAAGIGAAVAIAVDTLPDYMNLHRHQGRSTRILTGWFRS